MTSQVESSDCGGDGSGIDSSSNLSLSASPDHFHVYLLRSCKNSRRSFYIGKTTDPKKRIRQHNGEILGGAKQTRKASKRPWEMIVVVEGFPSRTSALQFEWQWQHPKKSKVVRSAVKRASASSKRTGVRRLLHILEAMLTSKLWRQYPLDVRICDAECYEWFKKVAESKLPSYMNVFLSSLSECAVYNKHGDRDDGRTTANADAASSFPGCRLCGEGIEGNFVECYHCTTPSHPRCLMAHFLTAESRAAQPDSGCGDTEEQQNGQLVSAANAAEERRHEPLLPAHGPCHYCGGLLTWPVVLRAFYHRHRTRRAAAQALAEAQSRVDAKCGGSWSASEVDALLAGVACHVDGFSGSLSSIHAQAQAGEEVGQVRRAVWGKILNDSKWFAPVLETRTKAQLRHKWEAVVKQAMAAAKRQKLGAASMQKAPSSLAARMQESHRARAHGEENVSVSGLKGSLPASSRLSSNTNTSSLPGGASREQPSSSSSRSQRRRLHDQVSSSLSGSVVDEAAHAAKKLQKFENDFDDEDGVFAHSPPPRNVSGERTETAQDGDSESDGSIVEILSSNEVAAADSAEASEASQSSATGAPAKFGGAKVKAQTDAKRKDAAKSARRRRPIPTLSSSDESSDELDFLV